MSSRIGITKNGIKEECTVQEPYPCVRHVIHSSNNLFNTQALKIDLDDKADDSAIISLNEYASFDEHPNKKEIVEHLNKISELQGEMAESWTVLLEKLENNHDEGTANLAKLHHMTVDEYKAWLANEDKTRGMWLDSKSDDDDTLISAKWATVYGDVVIITTEGDEDGSGTTFTRYIGQKPFSTVSVNRIFSVDDDEEIEALIKERFPF